MFTRSHNPASPASSTAGPAVHAMRSDEFVRSAIAIVVNPMMSGGTKRLSVADESQDALTRLQQEIAALAPQNVDNVFDWARGRIDALLAVCFADDVWYAPMPDGLPVVLVKESAIEGNMGISDVLRRVHVHEVSRALTEGVNVPGPVLDDYRVLVEAMTTEREGA